MALLPAMDRSKLARLRSRFVAVYSRPLRLHAWQSRYHGAMPRLISTLLPGCLVMAACWMGVQAPAAGFAFIDVPAEKSEPALRGAHTALAAQEPVVCGDANGFDRLAFHTEFNAQVLGFFQSKLP